MKKDNKEIEDILNEIDLYCGDAEISKDIIKIKQYITSLQNN